MDVGFGAFLSAAPGKDPAQAAEHAESLGFEMVTVFDHLHGRSPSVEPWTLLTWVAARTERVRVGTNVLGLPFRHPAVLAKMAETLDRLSGGRLVLGLGAGSGGDEFRAFGLAERSPGEKVEALEEALRIIRGLWTEGPFTLEGRHFTVREARIEPRPGHPIPIWFGVYGDRMLEVLGRYADGWIPSFFFLPPEGAFEKLQRLRAAAEAVGRDPDALTYAYNVWTRVDESARPKKGQVAGAPEQIAETLAGFVRGGFGFLNLSSEGDPVEQRERLAKEVIPLVREAAA